MDHTEQDNRPLPHLSDAEISAAFARAFHGTRGHQDGRTVLDDPIGALLDDASRQIGYVEHQRGDNQFIRTPKPAVSAAVLDISGFLKDGAPVGAGGIHGVSVRPTGETLDLRKMIEQQSRVIAAGVSLIWAAPRDRAIAINGEKTDGLLGFYDDPQLMRVTDPAAFAALAADGSGVKSVAFTVGNGYTDGTYPLTVTGGTGGAGAAATATIKGGQILRVDVTANGAGYTAAPSFALPAGAGAGTGATFTASLGGAPDAPVGTVPNHDGVFTWPTVPSAAFRVSVDRTANRSLGGGEFLRRSILEAVIRGVALYLDKTFLAALAATTPAAFSLGGAAAQFIEFANLRGLIGTTTPAGASIRQDGTLALAGIDAELTAASAASYVADWRVGGIAVWPEVKLLARRMSLAGDVEFTAFVNAQAVIARPGSFFAVA